MADKTRFQVILSFADNGSHVLNYVSRDAANRAYKKWKAREGKKAYINKAKGTRLVSYVSFHDCYHNAITNVLNRALDSF